MFRSIKENNRILKQSLGKYQSKRKVFGEYCKIMIEKLQQFELGTIYEHIECVKHI